MFIANNRGCNQMVSDADTLLLYITRLISLPRGTILIFWALKLKQRTPPLPLYLSFKGFLCVRAGVQVNFYCSFVHLAHLFCSKKVRKDEENQKKIRKVGGKKRENGMLLAFSKVHWDEVTSKSIFWWNINETINHVKSNLFKLLHCSKYRVELYFHGNSLPGKTLALSYL